MPDADLALDEVHTFYGDSHVVQGVSLRVAPSRVVALLGRNGMGKTTLMRSVVNMTPPRRGMVRFAGRELRGLKPAAVARLGIALVPQGRRIFRSLTVRENLMLPTVAGRSGTRWTLDSVCEEFPRLRERLGQLGGSLSGGEQSMLAIGRALMANPRLLLMDEPSEGLAPVIVHQIGELLRRLKQEGQTILLVEQNTRLALSVADEVHLMSAGRIVFSGTPVELEARPDVIERHLGV